MANDTRRSKSNARHVMRDRMSGQIVQQGSTKTTTKVSPAVPGGASFEGQIRTVHQIPAAKKISMIKNGVSKNELNEIKEESDLDYDTLSNILSVSRAKLINKKGAEKFDQATSERIMLLADVIAYGQSVFEDKDAFNEWMKKTNMALGSKTPLELMDTLYGIQEVKKEIGRIEYGVF
jgi:putative toxin-antitoxin system antitoxin component (TIGR02293 family)